LRHKNDSYIAVEGNRAWARQQDVDAIIYNEDCIAGLERRIEGASVDCVISSIPFGAL
jgi:hypothetical protein